MEYFLVARLILAATFIAINFGALIAERTNVRSRSVLLQKHPIARASVNMLWWVCFIQTVAVLFVAFGQGMRDFYAGNLFLSVAPTWVVVVNVVQTLMFYVILMAPGFALLFVMREIRRVDRGCIERDCP